MRMCVYIFIYRHLFTDRQREDETTGLLLEHKEMITRNS